MNITVIGTGFVGVVSSAVFASYGNTVYGLDIVPEKIASLMRGEIPFYEPGLEELVKDGIKKGTLKFTTSYQEAVSQSDVVILAVGTPSRADGQADLQYVFAAAESAAPFLKEGAIVAIKSTVPPGTNKELETRLQQNTKVSFFTASLPEFLREGSAVKDTLHPDRIVIGAMNDDVFKKLSELHKPFNAPILKMKPESAQMCKYSANAYLATRITFINQIANLCEVNGANILEVIQGIGYDKRIGDYYWYPGFGYGGSCFPKDVKELAAYAKGIHQDGNLMVKISELNEERIPMLMKKYEQLLGGWKGKTVGVLGLSFKPNTDDMREAPCLSVIPALLEAGATVKTYDPMAMKNAQKLYPSWNVEYKNDAYTAIEGCDAVFVLVEWPEIVSLDIQKLGKTMKPHALFIDARNQYIQKRREIQSAGFQYCGVGIS